MATYLPGITDFIPQIQPFKPDFNFYQAALQTKESQYKSGYDKLSNLYGTLLNSELLRPSNQEKRDKFFQEVQGEIQRLSSVDLSLEENVNTAYKVFQPIIDDRNITKDMVFTKTYRSQKQKGEALRNNPGNTKKNEDLWWKEGDLALDYQAEDFSKADDPTAMGMANPRYVPRVDVARRGMDLIKGMGINVQSVSWDKSGKYIVTTKGGAQLTIPLYSLLQAGLGDDPRVADMYQTKAYLKRKNSIKETASQFGGDELAAERAYLQAHTTEANDLNIHLQATTEESLKEIGAKKAFLEKSIKTNGALPDSQKKDSLMALLGEEEAQTVVKDHAEKGLALTRPDELAGADINVLRGRVDGAVANVEFSQAMMGIAQTYSALNSVQSIQADPYAKSQFDHMLQLDSMKTKFLIDAELQAKKYGYDKNLKAMDIYGRNVRRAAKDAYGNPENNVWKALETGGADPTATLTGVNAETQKAAYGAASSKRSDYLKKTYEIYNTMKQSKDPATQTIGETQLKNIFGKDPDGAFRALSQGSFTTAAITAYQNAVKANSANTPYITEENATGFNVLKSDIDNQDKVLVAIGNTSRENNKIALNYLKTLEKDADSVDADLFINSKGEVANLAQFTQAYLQSHPGDDADDAQERYKNLTDHWVTVLDKNVPGVKSYNSAFSNQTGGGVMFAKDLSIHVDPADPESEGFRTALSVREDIFNNPSVKVSDPDALPVVREWFEDIANNAYKETDDKRPSGNLVYHGIVGDRNTVGYTLKLDRDWLQANYGTEKNPGFTRPLFSNGKWNDTINFTLPKSSAKSSIASASTTNNTDLLLSMGPIKIDEYQWGGDLNLERVEGGGYRVFGTYKYIDENDDFKWKEQAKSTIIPPGVPAEVVINSHKAALKKLQEYNVEKRKEASSLYGTKDVQTILSQ